MQLITKSWIHDLLRDVLTSGTPKTSRKPSKPRIEVPGPLALETQPEVKVALVPMNIVVAQDPEDGYFETSIRGKLYRFSRKRDVKRRLEEKGFAIGEIIEVPYGGASN